MRKNRKFVMGYDKDINLLHGKEFLNVLTGTGIQALTWQEVKRIQKETIDSELKIYRLVLVGGGKNAKKK